MMPEIVLVLGSLGLGLVIAYGLWSACAPLLLSLEFGALRAELDSAMRSKGSERDIDYRVLRRQLDVFILGAAELTTVFALIFPLVSSPSRLTFPEDRDSWSPDKPVLKDVEEARLRMFFLVLSRLLTSPSALFWIFKLAISYPNHKRDARMTSLHEDIRRLERIAALPT